MSDSNQTTIDSYEKHIQEYIDGSPHKVSGTYKEWLDKSIAGLGKKARILEIGSAFGRDAKYIEEQGYTVECSDAVMSFVTWLKEHGFNARQLNVITDKLTRPYDLIFANNVLVHFTEDEVRDVIEKIYKALKAGGKFSFSIRQGDGERWSDEDIGAPRFFKYWNLDAVITLAKKAGFNRIDATGDSEDIDKSKRVHIIANK